MVSFNVTNLFPSVIVLDTLNIVKARLESNIISQNKFIGWS